MNPQVLLDKRACRRQSIGVRPEPALGWAGISRASGAREMKSHQARYLFALLLLIAGTLPAATFGQGAILHKSGPIQVTPNGQFVWVVNPDHDSVTRINVQSFSYILAQIPLPTTGG